ncbi:hypothetical protein B0H19DRAFT_1140238 [Mycena capillaripes]|nr:hypothetical protein B0H19DRAFT_1140238 [Mycena capillaripes]
MFLRLRQPPRPQRVYPTPVHPTLLLLPRHIIKRPPLISSSGLSLACQPSLPPCRSVFPPSPSHPFQTRSSLMRLSRPSAPGGSMPSIKNPPFPNRTTRPQASHYLPCAS